MKGTCFALVFLGLSLSLASAQECQVAPGSFCPMDIPISSDRSEGPCSNDIDGKRGLILQDISQRLSTSPLLYNALRTKYLGLNENFPADSCADIYRNDPSAESGLYFLHSTNVRGYCRFDFNTPGDYDQLGWERLTFSNFSDPSISCPSATNESSLVETSGARYCTKSVSTGCSSVYYTLPGPMTHMYGRVVGIQIGTGDIIEDRSIEDTYLDGVSLTYGDVGSREHIWSFMAFTSAAFNECPCSTNSPNTTPDFVGEHYFCESGETATMDFIPPKVYANDPLWDGQQCELTEVPCCNGAPWFYRDFGLPVSDTVELRICADQVTGDENVGVQLIELWFQ